MLGERHAFSELAPDRPLAQSSVRRIRQRL